MRGSQSGALCLGVAVLSVLFVTDAVAGDANPVGDFNADVQHVIRSDSALDRKAGTALDPSDPSSSASVSATVKDLETTRAAIDNRIKPRISLSVSGWVSEQVQMQVHR